MMPPKTAEIIIPLRFLLTVGTFMATVLVYFHRVSAPDNRRRRIPPTN
jgi:hypothetical protein